MQSMTRVFPLNSVEIVDKATKFRLALEWCKYSYGPNDFQHGFRFIWKKPEGGRLAHRGGARIPSVEVLEQLVSMAKHAGWADQKGV